MRTLRQGETLEEYAEEFWSGGEPLERESMAVCRECRTDSEWWKTGEEPNTVDSYVCPKCGKRHSVFWHDPEYVDLWEEIEPKKKWARASKIVDGKRMGLKCELDLVGGKFRWMTLTPQKFGCADSLKDAMDQVESFLHNR